MLGKLIKHEFYACGRLMGPAYLVVLAIALIGRIMTWLVTRQAVYDNVAPAFYKVLNGLANFLSIAYLLAFIALIILSVVFMIYRFYKNFFTDQGYLMMTLPTKPRHLVFSKFVNAIVFAFFSIVIALASLYISMPDSDEINTTLRQLFDAVSKMITSNSGSIESQVGVPLWVLVVEIVVFALIYLARFVISFYFCVAFGQLISKNHKILGGIVAFIVLEIATSILSSLYMALNTKVLPDLIPAITESSGKAMQSSLIGNSIIMILFTAVLYFIICRIMARRLNLD